MGARGCPRLSFLLAVRSIPLLVPGHWHCRAQPSRGPAEGRGGRRLAEGLRQGPNGMNGDWTGEPRWRERPLGVALRTREGQAASSAQGARREKFVAISLEVASARVAVLGRKTERAPGQASVGLLGLRFPVPSLSRVPPLPVILALPLAGSRISLLFVHGDPLWGKRRCEASCADN